MKIGFIGCGAIARDYLSRLDGLGGEARVAAFCDIAFRRAQGLGNGRNAGIYTDYRQMLEREELDAVFDNLPPFARGDELALAAHKGCHIFTTKPVGLDLKTAQRALHAIENAGVINSVGYVFRYSGITAYARELLAGRPLLLFVGQVRGPMPGGWNSIRALSGGQIHEMSTHIVDLARYFGGDVRSVYALGRGGHVPYVDFEDVSAVTLDFEGGAIGTVVSTCTVNQYFWGCTLIGDDLHLDLTFDAWTVRGHIGGRQIDYHDNISGYMEQIATFVQAVQTGDQSLILCSFRDGVGTLATTLAANRSLESGRAEVVVGG